MKSIEMETNLSETELYALLSKIQQVEIASAETLSKMLEAHNVKVTNITTSGQPQYTNAATLEIEELEEPKKQGFTIQCKVCDLNKKGIEQAIEAARESMVKSISENGMRAAKTTNLSQELDILIVAKMSK